MEFGKDNIESSFETLTENVESLQEKKENIENRESSLEQALAELEKDVALKNALRQNEKQLESEKEQLESETSDAKASLRAIQEQLEQLEQENDRSAATLDILRQIGESTEEGDAIIADRRAWLEECFRRVEELARMLGEDYQKIGKFIPASEQPERKMAEETELGQKNLEHFAHKSENAKTVSEFKDPKQAYKNYMFSHNWGKADFPVYSRDPEWRRLVHAAYPNYELPYMDPIQEYQQYMCYHNWRKEDFPVYSQDPEWRRIVHAAYPKYELPPQKNIGSVPFAQLPNVDLSHGKPNIWSATQEKFVKGQHGGMMYNSPMETGKRLYVTQGAAYRNITGTCGLCSCANVLRLAGVNIGEKEMVDYAVSEGLCTFQPENYEGSGATSPKERRAVLAHFGIQSIIEPVEMDKDHANNETMERIGDYVSEGRGVIVSVDAGVFYNKAQYLGEGHAVTVTSVEKNKKGGVIGYYICDSNYGTKFYKKKRLQKALRPSGINVTASIIR